MDTPTLSLAFQAAAAEEQQTDTAKPRATPADAFRLARRWFMQSRRVDMSELAATLGVSRNTLYRWTGDRERLLADVMWSVEERSIQHGIEHADAHGAERIAQVLDYVVNGVSHAPYMQTFLENESALAFRLITSREAGIESRTVAALAQLIRQAEADERYHPPVEPETLAYALTRMIEAFVYNDTFTGLASRPEAFSTIVRLLLREG